MQEGLKPIGNLDHIPPLCVHPNFMPVLHKPPRRTEIPPFPTPERDGPENGKL